MAPPKTITPFMASVLQAVEEFFNENAYAPTLRQIVKILGHGSTSSVKYAMERLAENGYLTPGEDGAARTQVPTYKPLPTYVVEYTEDDI